jgi:hypothetical protein
MTDRIGKLLEKVARDLFTTATVYGIDADLHMALEEKLGPLLRAGQAMRYAALGHGHWDSTMQHGAGCPLCIERRKVNEVYDAALATLEGRDA